ncbi:MAG: phosphatidate cytidylyltransferase [Opitutae bacterium]|nr:phosphatidate cytidylyltransferase [Opitutae bacterium]
MFSRIISTLLLWSVVLAGLWFFGADAAIWLLTLLTALTLHEFYALTEKMGHRPFRWLGLGVSVLMTAAPFYLTQYYSEAEEFAGLAPALLALALVVTSLAALSQRDNSNRVQTIAATLLGVLYVPFLLHYLTKLILLYETPAAGLVPCLWVIAVAKFCDVGALLAGLAFGRHKMAPNISPKKTWEGAAGGMLTSVALGAALAYFFPDYLPESLTPAVAALVALVLAVTAIASDLIESAVKRHADLKDSGTLIPGIGGAFDLTDSLIFTAPVAYLIFLFLS